MANYDYEKVKNNQPLMALIDLSSQQNDAFKTLLHVTNYSIAELADIVYSKKYDASNEHYNEFEKLNQIKADYDTRFYDLVETDKVSEDELEAVIDFFTD